jgi:hypothetical protein
MKSVYFCCIFFLIQHLNALQSYPETHSGGLWVWNGLSVVLNNTDQDFLIDELYKSMLTDVYLYIYFTKYQPNLSRIKEFNHKINTNGGRVWGLEGARTYFSDADGPSELYQSVQSLIDFNDNCTCETEKFYGFISDMEPHDQLGVQYNFHSGLPDSQLSSVSQVPISDTNHWTFNQLSDRRRLMADWLDIHFYIKNLLSPKGLKLSAAIPHWTDNYFGEPVYSFWNGTFQCVMNHMMTILDEYHVMSYQTDPVKNWNRVYGEVSYADTLPEKNRPKVFAGIETNTGVGSTVSYGDNAVKKSKTFALQDIESIFQKATNFTSFYGVDIHSWSGWKKLPF